MPKCNYHWRLCLNLTKVTATLCIMTVDVGEALADRGATPKGTFSNQVANKKQPYVMSWDENGLVSWVKVMCVTLHSKPNTPLGTVSLCKVCHATVCQSCFSCSAYRCEAIGAELCFCPRVPTIGEYLLWWLSHNYFYCTCFRGPT